MFIDIHAHLTDKRYKGEAEQIVSAANAANVQIIVDSGYDLASSIAAASNAERINGVYATVGIHPEKPQQLNGEAENELIKLCSSKRVIAIGEIGLDYHYEGYDSALQRDVFYRQIELADKLCLPFVVHSRDALKDTLDVLTAAKQYIRRGFLMHCYSESRESAKSFLDLGACFSFGGVTTFKNSRKCEIVKAVPLSRVFCETDSPYLTPEPFRGRINAPENVALVYSRLAEFYQIEVAVLEKYIEKNARDLFVRLG